MMEVLNKKIQRERGYDTSDKTQNRQRTGVYHGNMQKVGVTVDEERDRVR